MAEAEPTIRCTVRSGKPVVEVGGTWTVFSVRGIREKAEKALQAAGAAKAATRSVDARAVEQLDTAGALEILVVFVEACLQPKRFRFNAVIRQMYEVWIRALVIVGVLCFLIGVVIAYQGVQQLRQFGAETFTVEAVAIGMFRELGVLLTAIIVAGRSGSAFTAQIGTMQVNQEVDAMRTIGLNPIEWLVLPRIMALLFSMPLLAFWGDMAGVLGGAVACTVYLDFTFVQFFDRLRDTVGPWHFYTGMIKAPVFGIVIATIGCFEGLQVSGSAESVGQLTTKSVVEAIFCVIVLDAIFSVIFLLAGV